MIRPEMERWEQLSKRLIAITHELNDQDRDEVIAEIGVLLSERERLQPSIQAPFNEEEQLFGQRLLTLEAQLSEGLAAYMKNIRSDLASSQSKKTHVRQYMNPYEHVQRDGTRYDTKK